MTHKHRFVVRLAMALLVTFASAALAGAAAPESKRLIRARDYIADEQWSQAIDLLRRAVDDPKETRRDEALYWLAHSQHHSGDSGAAVATISRLEREYPSSMWVKPGQALRIEIAVRLRRNDVLWLTAVPPRPPAPSRPLPPAPPTPEAVIATRPSPVPPKPPPASKGARPIAGPPVKVEPPAPAPRSMWYAPGFEPDPDLQIQALGGLMRTDADKAIPILAQFAFEVDKPTTANRAVVVLAQSPLPKARAAVVKLAKDGPEPVRVTAVRELARFGGRSVSADLMQVYPGANETVKWQIVKSLGDLEQPVLLLQIIRSEKDGKVRFTALTSLARAGGADQLAAMYKTASFESKRHIIGGLFTANADTQLIRVAEIEKGGNVELRGEALQRLRLLDTPKAIEYVKNEPLQKIIEKR